MARATKNHITILSRRALLTRATVAVPVVAIAAAGTIAAVKMPHHPDADLLAAWQSYMEAQRVMDTLPLETSDEELEPYYEVKDNYRDMIERLPAYTAAGIAIKLQYLFMSYNESRWAELTIIHGHPHDEAELNGDYRGRMLWNLIADVQKMGA